MRVHLIGVKRVLVARECEIAVRTSTSNDKRAFKSSSSGEVEKMTGGNYSNRRSDLDHDVTLRATLIGSA
jgi:hypothetical protein